MTLILPIFRLVQKRTKKDKIGYMYPIVIHLGYIWIPSLCDFLLILNYPYLYGKVNMDCPKRTFFGQLFLSKKTRKWTKKLAKI